MRLLPIVILLTVLICFSKPIHATHLVGGETTWECNPLNGQYRFTVNLYRECGTPNPAGMPGSVNLTGGPTTIACSQIQLIDISPECYDYSLGMACGITPVGQGAKQMGVFKSVWTTLNGVPPSNGWHLEWASCCRPGGVSLNGNLLSSSYLVHAYLNSYKNQNANNFCNSSPVFMQPPVAVACVGEEMVYNPMAIDKENDSLFFDFGHAKQSNGVNSVYNSGYSFNNPLPDTSFHPENLALKINPVTGVKSFKCYTAGYYVIVTKVEEWRGGVLLSEIFRDIPIVIRNCAVDTGLCSLDTNHMPSLSLKVDSALHPNGPWLNKNLDQNGNFSHFEIEVEAGDSINFLIQSSDSDIGPDCFYQSIALSGKGGNLALDSAYQAIDSCMYNGPCATLTSQNVNGAFVNRQNNVAAFKWKASYDHINYPTFTTQHYSVNTFYFKASDLACAIPGVNFVTCRIKIKGDIIQPPAISGSCAVLDKQAGQISFDYTATTDTAQRFSGYVIYHSKNRLGPYLPKDTITQYQGGTITDGSITNTGRDYYFMRTVGDLLSMSTDTISPIYLTVEHKFDLTGHNAILNWNSPLGNNSTGNTYEIWKKQNATANWAIINSTSNLMYTDFTLADSTKAEYEIRLPGGCVSTNGEFIGLPEVHVLNNVKIYPIPFGNEITVELPEGLKSKDVQLELFDVSGKKVEISTHRNTSHNMQIQSLKDLPHGVYILNLSAQNKTKSFKLIH